MMYPPNVETFMNSVTVSAEYMIEIPPAIRASLGIEPGQELLIFEHDGILSIVPVRHPRDMRGFLSGIDTSIERDADRV
jgi:AbrB family looped-hinge helix DNA binding protein